MTRRRATYIPAHQMWGVWFAGILAVASLAALLWVGSAILSRITQ